MFRKGIKLQFAISLLVVLTVLCTVVVNWYSSAQALNDSLAKNYLESNEKYAKKLSLSTGEWLNHIQENINAMGNILGHQQFRQEDLDEWRSANSKYFNSLFITDTNGVIQLISPEVVQFKDQVKAGMKLQSETIKKALNIKKPFISEAYRATSGQLILLVSAPIFNDAGVYKGLIGGTIYLESDGAIKHLLNENEYLDGSYVYVVDHSGRILYHPDSSRIYDSVSENQVVQKVMNGQSGSQQVTNTEGNRFYAGYAYEENTGWGIISQTPTSVVRGPHSDLFENVILQSLPLLILILIIAGFLSRNLSKPLNNLARYSENATTQKKPSVTINDIKINSNIYEVQQLYHHLNNHLKLLNNQVQVDGLTGLANRKTFDIKIKELFDEKTPFSVIMIDIDRFKSVNDTYGHLVGDEVLKYLASKIMDFSTEEHLSFRYGGEEFAILSKCENVETALVIAENLRVEVANTKSPTGQPITISLGVSPYQDEDQYPEEIIKRADSALYQSKLNGRNQTTIYEKKKYSTVV